MISKACRSIFGSDFLKVAVKGVPFIVSKMSDTAFKTLSVTVPKEYVYHVQLNRPDTLNAMNNTMWLEIGKCFADLNDDENCRVVILSGSGRHFTAGIDLKDLMARSPEFVADDVVRRAKLFHKFIITYQNSISSLELCKKPILAAVHAACVGAGVDMITAADVRYCTNDAWFQVKEVDIGMAADVGTLQRLPKVIGSDSLARELCYTARKLPASEALSCGLVSRVYETKEKMLEDVIKTAEEIAQKSPVAIQNTKSNMVYSRDHTAQEGLDHIALLNQLALQSEDFVNGTMAQLTKEKPVFSKL